MNLSFLKGYSPLNATKAFVFSMIAATVLILGAMPMVSHAQFSLPTDDLGLAQADEDATVGGIITQVTEFLAALLAILAILAIVIAGILYITSGGDDDRINLAKSILIYAIVGLIVALLAFVIVTTIASALNAG